MTQPQAETDDTFQERCRPCLNAWSPYRMTRDAVTETAIRRFCEVAQDGNPVYWDEEFAKTTRFGRVVAPPQSLFSMAFPAWWTPAHVQEKLAEETAALNGGRPPDEAGGVHAVCDEFGYAANTVAGQVHQVTLTGRQGYGRANLDLLRRRVLAS